MTGIFDPQAFLDATVEGQLDTTLIPCPIGEFQAQISKIDVRPWTGKNDLTKSGVALDVQWEIQDQGVKDTCQRDKVTVKQGIMLDLTEDGKGLDMGKGKNIGLGRLREAVGLNNPGQPFAFNMLPGQMAKVSVNHRPADNGVDVYAEVKAVAKL
jgi:hypothetical protein